MMSEKCHVVVDKDQKESLRHGDPSFPIAFYDDDLSDVPWHWHEEWESGIIMEGRVNISTPKGKVCLKRGDAFFINTQVLHQMEGASAASCRLYSFVFREELISGSKDSIFHMKYAAPLLEDYTKQFLYWKKDEDDNAIFACMEHAWQIGQDEKPGYEFQVREALTEMILKICLMQFSKKEKKQPEKEVYRIKEMLSFIEDNYRENISLTDIAKAAHISESEALRIFKKVMGISPVRYLIRYRMQKAQSLLLTTDMYISEIGAACGYGDLSYFTKTFRSFYGIPPAAYRRAENEKKR